MMWVFLQPKDQYPAVFIRLLVLFPIQKYPNIQLKGNHLLFTELKMILHQFIL